MSYKLLTTMALTGSFFFHQACNDASFKATQDGGDAYNSDAIDVSDYDDYTEATLNERSDERVDTSGREIPTPGHGRDDRRGIPDGEGTPGGQGTTVIKLDELFASKCSEGEDASRAVIEYSAPRNHRVEATIRGEFCPQQTNLLNIVFVVDYSASMGYHEDPENPDAGPVEGNDPLTAQGTCGRLAAVQAIYQRLLPSIQAGHRIRIGVVPFASGIVSDFVLPLAPGNGFQNEINAQRFCRYVPQREELIRDGAITAQGGLLGIGRVGPSTNYEAALEETSRVLARQPGRNVVYFISDGEPTAPARDPVGRGAAAATQLRQGIANLSFNGLMLGSQRPEAERVLELVTGSPDRVRYANNASQLADQILEFPDASIDPNHPQNGGFVHVEPYADKPVPFTSFEETSPGVWTYTTHAIVLLGIPERTIENRVTLNAYSKDGSTHQSVISIRYTQE